MVTPKTPYWIQTKNLQKRSTHSYICHWLVISFFTVYCTCRIFHAYSSKYLQLSIEKAWVGTRKYGIAWTFRISCASWIKIKGKIPDNSSDKFWLFCLQVRFTFPVKILLKDFFLRKIWDIFLQDKIRV